MNKSEYESCAFDLISFTLGNIYSMAFVSLVTYNTKMHPCYNTMYF